MDHFLQDYLEKTTVDRKRISNYAALLNSAIELRHQLINPDIVANKLCICPMIGKISQQESDYLMTQYCKMNSKIRIAVIYPLAFKHLSKIKNVIKHYGSILYRKTIEVDKTMLKNLVWLYYIRENRMGYQPSRSEFWLHKVDSTFEEGKPMTVYVFHPNKLEKVREMKETVREVCKHGFHSIHVNDRSEETIQMAKALLHDSTLTKYQEKLFSFSPENINKFFLFLESFNLLPFEFQDGIMVDLNALVKSGKMKYETIEGLIRNPVIEDKLGKSRSKRKFRDSQYYDDAFYFNWFGVKCRYV